MRSVVVILALALSAPAAAVEVVVLLDSGETVQGELIKHKAEKFYVVQPPEGKAQKLKWDVVVDIRSLDPSVQLELTGSEPVAGEGLPDDAKRSKTPRADVETIATQHEQKLSELLSDYKPASTYWLTRSDAAALAVSALPPEAEIVESDADHAASDYLWSTEEGIEEGVGEWHDQSRERLLVEISPGPFVSVSPFREVAVRRFYGGKGQPIWKTDREALELNLATALQQLEQETMDQTAVILAPTEARRLMKPTTPEGFELEATADGVVATRVWTEARANPKTGDWARWERVHTVTFDLRGEGSEKRVTVNATEVERVITNDHEPDFSPSLTVDPRPATQMLRGLLRAAGVRARMPTPLLEPVGVFQNPGSAAPAVPTLRTWAEVRADQEAESVASLTGTWRILQPEVRVPATRSDGSPYDVATEDDGAEPDLAVHLDINGTIGDLETAQDTLEHTWRWQADEVFRRGQPAILVTIADIDLDGRETAGFCELRLEDLLQTEWHKCGATAKIKLGLQWVDPAPADEFELPD